MTTHLQVKLLGPPQIWLDDNPVSDFTYQKSLALLSYLMVTKQTHPRSFLATLLWGESSEANARAQLRTVLAELRQQLGPYLEVSRKAVAFNCDSNCWLDVDVFAAACEAIEHGPPQVDPDINTLKTAVDLYRGDFLQGFQVRKALDFEQWMLEQQEWLHKLAEQALHTIVDDCLARGTDNSYTEGLEYVNRLLTLTPWYERAHWQKMYLLGLMGQRSQALVQYQRCTQILAEHFAAAPTAETIALYEQIKDDKLKTQRKEGRTAVSAPDHNLPAPVITFIGRKKELEEVTALLLDPEHRFITLVGEGGVGKTHLAQVAARQALTHFRDGVWFVPLINLPSLVSSSPETLSNMLATTIANALNITFYGPDSPKTQLFNRLRDKQLLLILDNFEHLLAGADFVLDLLKSAPQVIVLVTSRARLRFRAEYALRLDGLPVPSTDNDPTAVDYDSVKLFVDRAKRISGSFALTADNLPQVVQLCRLVEGLPLGIELVSAWVEHLSLAEIIANLREDIAAVTATDQDIPERHHCLRVVFENSWRLLSKAEQRLLAELSVFRGDFSRNAALSVTGAELAQLMALVDKSLLKTTYPGRYILHELLRQFAADKLTPTLIPDVSKDEVSERHSAYYVTLVNEKTDTLHSNEPQPAVETLQTEIANIRQAWEWGTSLHFAPGMSMDWLQSKTLLMSQGVKGLSRFYDIKGMYQEGELIFGAAAERIRAQTSFSEIDRVGTMLLSRVLGAQGYFLLMLGDFSNVTTLVQGAIALTEQVEPDDEIQANKITLFKCLGDAYRSLSDYRSAFDAYTQSLNIALDLSNQPGIANARQSLAWVAINQGEFDKAETLAKEALELYHEIGNQRDIAFAVNTLGTVAIKTGKYAQAQAYYEQGLEIQRQLEHPRGIAESLNNLGTVMSEVGQFNRARQCYEECLAIVQKSGNRPAIANILNNLGGLAGAQTKYQEAQRYFEKSLEIRREIGDQYGIATSLNNLAAIARYLEDYKTARRYAEESLALHIEIAHRPGAVYCLDNLGFITAAQGDLAAAWRYFREALQESLEVKAVILTLDALTGIAGLLAQSGDYARAAQLLGLTLNHTVTQPETRTNAEPILEILRQTLSEDELTMEMDHGKSLDLRHVVAEVLNKAVPKK